MAGRGSKPGERRGGRKAGTPNKVTRTVKEAFEAVFQDMQKDPKNPANLAAWAETQPTEFYKLAAKLIPSEIKANVDVKFEPKVECVIGAMIGEK